METTEPDTDKLRVGPAERPDDPLAAAQHRALSSPLTARPEPSDRNKKPAPPTPDQEGCYYLG